MKRISLTLLVSLVSAMFLHAETPAIINDRSLTKDLGDKIGKLVDTNKTTNAKALGEQLTRVKVNIALPAPRTEALSDLYADRVDSVGIIASVYKCGRCDDWHRSGCATCWVLTEDGIMVTNYHVFENADHSGWGVLTRDGRVSAVTEVLAANKAADIAIFRVAGAGYKPIHLGDSQKVGGDVHIIAHPDSRFFSYTSGKVSRYYEVPRKTGKATWMSVTAEFARGSSGGPVMDQFGNVVGMVANTQSIYYPKKKPTDFRGPFQMVIRNCVPVADIRKLIGTKTQS